MTSEVKNQALHVIPGMKVENVLRNGSQEQKEAIKLFDWDNNGNLSRKEAEAFNSYSITNAGGRGQLTLRHSDKNKGAIVIDYNKNDLKDFEKCKVNKNGVRKGEDIAIEGDNWHILHVNLPKKEVTIQGLENSGVWVEPEVWTKNLNKLNILDSSLDCVVAKGVKNIYMENTADKDYLYDSKTYLLMDKDANIITENKSKLDIDY